MTFSIEFVVLSGCLLYFALHFERGQPSYRFEGQF